MTKLNSVGFGAVVLSVAAFLFEKLSANALSDFVARRVCGASNMKEPDLSLAAKGILSENACGFDADMYFAVFALFIFLAGLAIMFVKFWTKRINNKETLP